MPENSHAYSIQFDNPGYLIYFTKSAESKVVMASLCLFKIYMTSKYIMFQTVGPHVMLFNKLLSQYQLTFATHFTFVM